jgi:hypothetical protein
MPRVQPMTPGAAPTPACDHEVPWLSACVKCGALVPVSLDLPPPPPKIHTAPAAPADAGPSDEELMQGWEEALTRLAEMRRPDDGEAEISAARAAEDRARTAAAARLREYREALGGLVEAADHFLVPATRPPGRYDLLDALARARALSGRTT